MKVALVRIKETGVFRLAERVRLEILEVAGWD